MDRRSESLQYGYQKRFAATTDCRKAVWYILCRDFFAQYIQPNHTILDLGAGWGEFTRNIVANKKYAMDLNPDCGRNVAGFADFIQQDCSKQWPLPDASLDVVFTSNFLEHLPSKSAIDATLKEAYRCLKPGGKIICMGPNIRYLPGAYWDYWDHFIPITEASMAEALLLQSFRVEQNLPKFIPYTMSGRNNPPPLAVKAYLKMPFFWRFFGKQFLVVAVKES